MEGIVKMSGAFRTYIKLPFGLGLKIARLSFKKGVNTLAVFLTACIMNLLERKRYLYYTKKRFPYIDGEFYSGKSATLCPTYFSCGVFNIVKHVHIFDNDTEEQIKSLGLGCLLNDEPVDKEVEERLDEMTAYLSNDIKLENLGLYDGKVVLIDYGDFNVDCYNRQNIYYIDYK